MSNVVRFPRKLPQLPKIRQSGKKLGWSRMWRNDVLFYYFWSYANNDVQTYWLSIGPDFTRSEAAARVREGRRLFRELT